MLLVSCVGDRVALGSALLECACWCYVVYEGSIPLFIIALLRGIDHDKALRCLAFTASNQVNNIQKVETAVATW